MNSFRIFILCLSAVLLSNALNAADVLKERWLRKSGFGLMFHYEAFKNHNPQSYNQAIDSFEVDRFVEAVESTKAGYIIFVIGQHWGKYCAPNSAYEKLLGVKNGVWTSKRDLIKEIGEQLAKRDIKLIIYMTARAPSASAFTTSAPRRIPPSKKTSTLAPAPCTTSGSVSMVESVVSRLRDPWLDTISPFTPYSAAMAASSPVIMPLNTMGRSVTVRSHFRSSQVAPGSFCPRPLRPESNLLLAARSCPSLICSGV